MSLVAFIVLFIQTEDVLAEKENKNLKVVERFRVEQEFAQGSLCVELEERLNDVLGLVFIAMNLLLAEPEMYLN